MKNRKNLDRIFVPYEIARELEKKGFNQPCYQMYRNGELIRRCIEETISQSKVMNIYGAILAPTHQQVIDWLREIKQLVLSYHRNGGYYFFEIYDISDEDLEGAVDVGVRYDDEDYYTALNGVIVEALKLI